MDLKDKVIVVTGGGQGLGRAIACGLAAKGAVLALVDLNPERLEETVALCREAGGDARAYIANVAAEAEVVDLFNAGVATMAVSWGKELARHGIRTAAIAPGFVGTEMVASMKPEALAKMESQIPLGRVGQPEEIAHTAVFLFENDYITGRVIETDGGIRL